MTIIFHPSEGDPKCASPLEALRFLIQIRKLTKSVFLDSGERISLLRHLFLDSDFTGDYDFEIIMDDRTFDQKTAQDWIDSVEAGGKNLRDIDIYPMLNDWLKQTSPSSVLDIGCGQGICSDKINLNECSYVGVEPSPALLNRAQQLYQRENRTFLAGNAYQLPIRDNELDAAFSVLVWHLLENLQLAAHELSRVLAKGGSFLIITANPGAYSSWKAFYSDLQTEGKRLVPLHSEFDGQES